MRCILQRNVALVSMSMTEYMSIETIHKLNAETRPLQNLCFQHSENNSKKALWHTIQSSSVYVSFCHISAAVNRVKVISLISSFSLVIGVPVTGMIMKFWLELSPRWAWLRIWFKARLTHLVPAPEWTTSWCSASCGWHLFGSEPSCGPEPRQSNRPRSERPAMKQRSTGSSKAKTNVTVIMATKWDKGH